MTDITTSNARKLIKLGVRRETAFNVPNNTAKQLINLMEGSTNNQAAITELLEVK